MAKQSIATVTVDGNVAAFHFANGQRVDFDSKQLSDEIKHQLMMHGAVQKIRDSFAGAKGDANFAQAQAEGVVEALLAGDWNRRGGGAFGGNLLAEAVARIKDISLEDARAKLAALTDEERETLKKAKSVKQMILTIKAERLSGEDSDGGEIDDLI